MSAQYFNWTATGMRFAERSLGGPTQYVRADEYEKLLHEAERLRLIADKVARDNDPEAVGGCRLHPQYDEPGGPFR